MLPLEVYQAIKLSGLVVDARVTQATGTAEPEAALAMLGDLPGSSRKTVGADKNYDTAKFVAAAREMSTTPHVAQNINGHRAVRTSIG